MSSIASQASAGRALTRRSSAGRTGLVLGALLVLAAAGSLWLAARAQTATEDLPVLAAVPDFTLTEASGRTVTRQDLAGHPYVVDLVFTHCGGICPTMSAAMSRLVGSTSTLPDLRFVSISVDPKNDTPEVLTAYAERFQADRTRWLFLTGDEKAIRELAIGGLKQPLADGDPAQGEDAILHSQRFVLVDAQSQVRGTYDVRDPEAMLRLRSDLERLNASARG
ncbi:SCO family protein [Candidatus Binatia bacterium]|nr:SCO family protein [Candidatus Binatia bacterium]